MTSPTTEDQDTPSEIPETPREPIDWGPWLWGGLLALLVGFVYFPTLGNGFIWDDDAHVLSNVALRSGDGLYNMWFKWGAIPQYYPLVHTTLWVEYQLWGFQPAGYHLVNMLMQAACAILLWRVLLRLNVPGAWLAAAIFAVHPVCVESVAWVSELKNLQSAALALGSILVYLRYAPPEEPADARRNVQGWDYELSLSLFIAALLSKTVTAVVPAVLLVIYWWKRGRIVWRDVAELSPMFLFGAALSSVTVWLETSFVGASGSEWNYTPLERILIAGRALWFYAGKIVWPYPLSFFYPRFAIDTHAPWQYLFPVGAIAVLVGLWAGREKWGRGPFAAVLIFCIAVFPALGFFDVYPFRYSQVADHFQFQGAMALIALGAAVAVLAARSLPTGVAAGLGAVLLVPLAVTAQQKTHVYRNLETLYTDVLHWNPASWIAHINLADYLERSNRTEEAIPHYREGLDHLGPNNWHVGDLSRAFELTGQIPAAVAQFQQDLDSDLTDVEKSELHRYIGDLLVLEGKNDEAIKHFESAIELNPDNAMAMSNLGQVLLDSQDLEGAEKALEKSIAINPAIWRSQLRLGILRKLQGQVDDAMVAIAHALQLNPNSSKAREEFATLLLVKGDLQNAVVQLQQALILDPNAAGPHYLAGVILGNQGKLDAAMNEFEAAVKLDPNHKGAKENIAKLREFQEKQQGAAPGATPATPATTPPGNAPPADGAPANAAPPATDSPPTDPPPSGNPPADAAPQPAAVAAPAADQPQPPSETPPQRD